ncbi:Stigma-specific protein stig1 [Thalictrum thalictroides]|uniref:Stigma-specific protein stig1 n=1 Tax=Thalictrum thalictroides TaxID=46969 RepID=A0A7J6VYE8_THATH|nr:Stigma-specific protein stig1 [Thalictrum thalictroides]
MALTMLKHVSILSLTIIPWFLILHSCSAFETDIEDGEVYLVDTQSLGFSIQAQSRYQPKKVKKGARCDAITNNICNGISVNNGTGLLQCCKKHCRNVLGDRNNCGTCGQKCGFGKLCCKGKCINVAYNVDHCGKCNVKCSSGLKCEYGTCGYA